MRRVSFILIALALGEVSGCSQLLDYGPSSPFPCATDADCARYPNAACDSARKQCVPRLPFAMLDAGAPVDAGGGGPDDGPGPLTCELSFDNAGRLSLIGPDGGLRPLPEGP